MTDRELTENQAKEINRLTLAEHSYRSTLETVISMLKEKNHLDEDESLGLTLLQAVLDTFNNSFEYKEPN